MWSRASRQTCDWSSQGKWIPNRTCSDRNVKTLHEFLSDWGGMHWFEIQLWQRHGLEIPVDYRFIGDKPYLRNLRAKVNVIKEVANTTKIRSFFNRIFQFYDSWKIQFNLHGPAKWKWVHMKIELVSFVLYGLLGFVSKAIKFLLTELVGQCRNILPLAFSALTSRKRLRAIYSCTDLPLS